MRLNRRNVLVGLGTIVAGGGAALGTGAFSSVEATRSINIETDGDGAALLQIEPNDDYGGDQTNVVTAPSDDELEIDIGADGDEGINLDATTTFNNVLTVTNQGTQDVGFSVSGDDIGDEELLDFRVDSHGSLAEESIDLSSDGGSTDISLAITTVSETENSDFPESVTFIADVEDHSSSE